VKLILLISISIISAFAEYDATVNADELGMYYQDYNSMMALTGILMGATIMFGMIFLTIKVGSSR
jgi:hypothetical protein